MAYVPDPTDASQPTDTVPAGTADEEFRALKAYIQALVIGSINPGPGTRQTALDGSRDANGDANFLAAGTGLALNLSATSAPLCLTYADGSNSQGDVNFSESVGLDAADVVTGLAPSNLNYITKLLSGAWAKTLAPCQYGKLYDKTAQFLVRWPGANNAVATTEDFGSTLTFVGNAKLSTATQILGLNTLACDGTGDYVTAPFTGFGDGSWEVFGSFRTSSLAAAQAVVDVGQAAASFGVLLEINTAGKLVFYVSSNGTGADIVAGVAGATTVAINTTYFYRLVYDAVATTYRVYLSNNGAAEVQDQTTTSALKVCTPAVFCVGAYTTGTTGFNGFIGYTGFRRWASFTSAQAVGPTVAPTFADVALPFFNISQKKMYEVTAASTVAGTNPAMASIKKLYLAETVTNGAGVVSVTNYAYEGVYTGPFVSTLPLNAATVIDTKIGTDLVDVKIQYRCKVVEGGYAAKDLSTDICMSNGTYIVPVPFIIARNTVTFLSGISFRGTNKATRADFALTPANWEYQVLAARRWGR